jgi:hypothetical protein
LCSAQQPLGIFQTILLWIWFGILVIGTVPRWSWLGALIQNGLMSTIARGCDDHAVSLSCTNTLGKRLRCYGNGALLTKKGLHRPKFLCKSCRVLYVWVEAGFEGFLNIVRGGREVTVPTMCLDSKRLWPVTFRPSLDPHLLPAWAWSPCHPKKLASFFSVIHPVSFVYPIYMP